MKIRDVIYHLSQFDQDATLLISSDEEGNQYGDLGDTLNYANVKDEDGNKAILLYPLSSFVPY